MILETSHSRNNLIQFKYRNLSKNVCRISRLTASNERDISMNTLNLSLRQKKILYILQNQTSFITGKKIASDLNVTARTIRNDIQELNHFLIPYNTHILSEQSKGYLLYTESPDTLKELNQNDVAFFTKEDRVRYLAFQLCLSDEPLSLFDLEDEMYISHTTLIYDIHEIKKKYTMKDPHIELIQGKNTISFEKDEHKIRSVLLKLFHDDWDYNTKGNAYYGYYFLDEKILNYLMETIPRHLKRYHIRMEDPALVALELSLAIMYHRICSGHTLPESALFPMTDTAAYLVTKDLFCDFEKEARRSFPSEEKNTVYRFISHTSLLDESLITRENAKYFIGPVTIEMADLFLARIKRIFKIDFSDDDEFYIALLLYLRSLQNNNCIFYLQKNTSSTKKNLLPELEFAYLFQDIAFQFMKQRLTEIELINLAFCLSGALEYHFTVHPEKKVRTVICCHMNLPTTWAIKRKALAVFGNYLEVTDLIPVNTKDTFDFSQTDLILSTVKKTISSNASVQTLFIDSFVNFSDFHFQGKIKMLAMKSLCPRPEHPFKDLFQNAYWHENEPFTERLPIIETMMDDYIRDEIASEKHLMEILNRESISSFAIENNIVFLHSIIPAKETRLSFMTLAHRVVWDCQKIQMVVMAVFRKEDRALLFYLNNLFYHNPDITSYKIPQDVSKREDFFHSIGI